MRNRHRDTSDSSDKRALLDIEEKPEISSSIQLLISQCIGRLLKLADRMDLGSIGATRESSSLSSPTSFFELRICFIPQQTFIPGQFFNFAITELKSEVRPAAYNYRDGTN